MAFKDTIEKFIVWSNREPILTIRRVLWVISAGWALFAAYVLTAVGMALSLVFIPFVPQVLKFAWFALDPTTNEPYSETADPKAIKSKPWTNPLHPFSIAANVIWLIFFGWGIFGLFIMAALIQALTIINIGTAITLFKLASFAVWPFGRQIRKKHLPTTVEELRAQKEQEKQEKLMKKQQKQQKNQTPV